MATLQGKAVKNTYRQVLQIGANNVGVSGTMQPVQDGAGVNTALSLSTAAATINGTLTITGDLIITGGGIQIQDLIDDTVASLIQNGTGITWTYNDGARTLTGNFTGTTSVVPEGSNLYYTQGRFDSAFAAKSTTNLSEGTNLYFTTARGNANFATNLAASDTDDLAEGATNLYYTNSRARLALSITAGTGISYNNTTGVFNLAAIPNASLTNSSITINSQSVALGGSVTLTTTNIAEGDNLYWTNARFDSRFGTKTTTDLAEGTNLYYTQARFNTAFDAKTTTDLDEGTNLYYTDARARLALASSATGLTYANNSGIFSLTAGYAIPTTVKLGQYDTAYNRSIVSAAVTGTTTKTLSLTQQDANVVSATWTDLGITTINGTANQIATTTVGNTTTVAFTNDVTMPNNLIVSGNLTINGTATYVNTQSISAKDPLFEVANDNNTTDAVDIGYYGRYYDTPQTRVEFTGLFRDASDAGKFKFFTGLVDEPTNVVNTTGTGYTVGTLVANFEGNLAGTANAANALTTARTIAASGDAVWSVNFDGSANVSSALTLANTGVTATTYGTSTSVPTIAVDGKGRITSASNTNIAFPVTTVNGFAGTVVLTTSDVAEGSNQYFTTARAQAAISGTAPISVASGVVSISQAGGATNGYLSSTDWNTFNNKLSTATAASTYVPYTGATGAVNLGAYDLAVQGLTIGKGLNSLSNNSALGYQALFHTTTGNFNTAVGYQSGHNTTTATYNTSIGQSSLFANTTGGLNTAIGVNALLNTTTGTSNVALGLDSLQHNTTGSSNTALGYNAGSHITGGSTPNTTASNSVFIGRDSKAKLDNGANEIVIGYNAVGNGSNTVTIGNSSITNNYFNGAMTLNGALSGTSATFTQTVSNKLTLSGGSTQNGLTLDAVSGFGNAFYIFNGNGGLGNGFGIFNNTTSTLPFHISNAGAATFAGTLTVTGASGGNSITVSQGIGTGGDITINKASAASFIANNTSASGKSYRLFSADSGQFIIQNTGVADLVAVTSGGSVGIGTTSPSYRLQVSGTSTSLIKMSNTSANRGIIFGVDSGSEPSIQAVIDNSDVARQLSINPSGGNVGIGTSSPSEKLQILGNLRLTGNNIATPNTLISEINAYAGTSNQFKSSSIKFYTGTFVDQGFITFNTSVSGVDVVRLTIAETGAATFSGAVNASAGRVNILGTNQNSILLNSNAGGTSTGFLIGRSLTTTDSQDLFIYDVAAAATRMTISSAGNINFSSLGTGTVQATSGTLSTISDMNLKDEDGFIDNALEKVLKLKPRYFHWKEESGLPTDLRQLGFYAQEVNEALGEEAANTPKTENDKWGIYDRGMIAFLTKAIQEQQAQIEELKAMIAAK